MGVFSKPSKSKVVPISVALEPPSTLRNMIHYINNEEDIHRNVTMKRALEAQEEETRKVECEIE